MTGTGIRVLVVDDSAVTRMTVRDVLLEDPRIAAVEMAADGRSALDQIAALDPDVVTLDVEMPEMDGISTLRKIMTRQPRPVIMLSAHTFAGAEKTIRALEWGAVDVVQKPFGQSALKGIALDLRNKVVAVGEVRRKGAGLWRRWSTSTVVRSADRLPRHSFAERATSDGLTNLVVIGASTGGTEALHYILSSLPGDFPAPIVVVQHMPEFFTGAFARRLSELCMLDVNESCPGAPLRAGTAIIARGNHHLAVRRRGPTAHLEQNELPPVNGHRPSVDVLFRSVAALKDVLSVGVLLTGMGRDGAEGLLAMRRAGAITIAQDESSCVVYGMPKAAVELGAADYIADIRRIPSLLLSGVSPTGPRLLGRAPCVRPSHTDTQPSRAGAAVAPSPTTALGAPAGTAPGPTERPERPPSGRHP